MGRHLPLLTFFLGLLTAGASAQAADLARWPVGVAGAEPNGESRAPAVSEDGRWIAFKSFASNLVVGDTNAFGDVFVLDREGGVTTLVSISVSGGAANGESYAPVASSSARYIAFYSAASNLVTGDTNARMDVFVRDRIAGTTTLVSRTPSGALGNGDSDLCSISLDGTRIAFRSAATNLVTGDTNGKVDVFLRDLTTGATSILSRGAGNLQSNQHSFEPVLSGDGRYVCFSSDATNLVASDTNGVRDVFLRDVAAGSVTRLSASLAGTQGNATSDRPTISRDGRWIAFDSAASNLVPGDTGTVIDAFLVTSNRDTLVQVTRGNALSQECALSGDGTTLAFSSAAFNLVPGDTNARLDIFVYDVASGALRRESTALDGTQGNGDSQAPALGYSGNVLAYRSGANNLVLPDTNGAIDIFCSSREFSPLATVPMPAGLDLTDACLASGDFDGDTFDELFVGCPDAVGPTGSPEGAVLIFRGTATGLEPQPTWTLYGGQPHSRFGFSLASAVDINNDCLQDLLVGAPAYDNGELNEGAAFLFHGRAAGVLVTTHNEMREGNSPNAEYGYSVGFVRLPDIDYFGSSAISDVFEWLIGAPGIAGGRGRIHIGAQVVDGTQQGERLGSLVLSLDNDICTQIQNFAAIGGDSRVVASAPGHTSAIGRVGALYWFTAGIGAPFVTDPFSSAGVVAGTHADSDFATSLTIGGDLDGDGLSEVVVGAPAFGSPGLARRGRISWCCPSGELTAVEGVYAGAELGRGLASVGDLGGASTRQVSTFVQAAVGGATEVAVLLGREISAPFSTNILDFAEWELGVKYASSSVAGRLQSRSVLLKVGGGSASLIVFEGTRRPDPCKPYLSLMSGGGPGQGYVTCSGWDQPYSEGVNVINPTCQPISWSVVSGTLPGNLRCSLAGPQVLAPKSSFLVGLDSFGWTTSVLSLDCTQCFFLSSFPVEIQVDQSVYIADFRAANQTPCYELSLSSDNLLIDCASGASNATVTVTNPDCETVWWTIWPLGASLPAGVNISPMSGYVGPQSSSDIIIDVDCQQFYPGSSFQFEIDNSCLGVNSEIVTIRVDGLLTCFSSYCMAGTSQSGCVANMVGTGIPRAPGGSAGTFQLKMESMPENKTGLIYYGLSPVQLPWGPGSTSSLCVAFPVERLLLATSTGAASACDGSIEIELNGFLSAHPGAVGAPFAVGQVLYAQGWYRDPGAPKNTHLSNGLRITLCH